MDNSSKGMYLSLYCLLEKETPLRFDCGRLCGAACCQVTGELPGMYLFPGEEVMFTGKEGFTLSEAQLPGFGPVRLLSCEGRCERAARPLSCRIFPLAPRVEQGRIAARPDPRGRVVCPLCRGSSGALSSSFTDAVEQAFARLWEDPETHGFIEALSRHLDEFDMAL